MKNKCNISYKQIGNIKTNHSIFLILEYIIYYVLFITHISNRKRKIGY